MEKSDDGIGFTFSAFLNLIKTDIDITICDW
jgi:hypothetical protein